MQSKVHPTYKTKYRVANWAAYNQALVRRGDVTVWLSSEAIAAWTPGTYAANSAWQHLVVLTHNLLTNFQIETGAVRRTPSRKRTVLHVLQTIQSLRFAFFNRAAQLVRPHGTLRLRLMDNLETRRSYERVANALARAA